MQASLKTATFTAETWPDTKFSKSLFNLRNPSALSAEKQPEVLEKIILNDDKGGPGEEVVQTSQNFNDTIYECPQDFDLAQSRKASLERSCGKS